MHQHKSQILYVKDDFSQDFVRNKEQIAIKINKFSILQFIAHIFSTVYILAVRRLAIRKRVFTLFHNDVQIDDKDLSFSSKKRCGLLDCIHGLSPEQVFSAN